MFREHTADKAQTSPRRYGQVGQVECRAPRKVDGGLPDRIDCESSTQSKTEGDKVKIYIATYDSKDAKVTVPVAAQSLQHAARKAEKEKEKRGELVKLELTKEILI